MVTKRGYVIAPEELLPSLLAVLATLVAPGPDIAFVLASGVSAGRWGGSVARSPRCGSFSERRGQNRDFVPGNGTCPDARTGEAVDFVPE
jgi:hypothetical protein